MAALEEIAQRTRQQFGVSCVVQADANATTPAKDATSVQLFRIAQEAVHNAGKHAHATKILIHLSKQNGTWLLTVKDDGVGLPDKVRKDGGMGLRIMQYRARIIHGSLSVNNAGRPSAKIASAPAVAAGSAG
ncbi:MAG: ATP-binding protein [Hyphomicrobium sp.]